MGSQDPKQAELQRRERIAEMTDLNKQWHAKQNARLGKLARDEYGLWDRVSNAPSDLMDSVHADRLSRLEDGMYGYAHSEARVKSFNDEWERAKSQGPSYKPTNTWLLMGDPMRRIPAK
jgi:hypothetical protein